MLATTFGCAEEASDLDTSPQALAATQSGAVDDCNPSGDFDTCYEIDLDEVEYWQDTMSDPAWRGVEEDPDGYDVDYKVTLRPMALNAGVIPTADGQGEYDSVEHYKLLRAEFLGLSSPDDSVLIKTIGNTVKQTADGGPTHGSSGVFVYDALTNSDGQIIIDGEDRTDEFIDRRRFHAFEQVREDLESGTTTSMALDDDDALSTSSNSVYEWGIEDEETVKYEYPRDNIWAADLRIGWNTKNHYYSDFSGLRLDGTECVYSWEWDVWRPSLTKECYERKMGHALEVLEEDGSQVDMEAIWFPDYEYTNSLSYEFIFCCDWSHPAYQTGKSCSGGQLFNKKSETVSLTDDIEECLHTQFWDEPFN